MTTKDPDGYSGVPTVLIAAIFRAQQIKRNIAQGRPDDSAQLPPDDAEADKIARQILDDEKMGIETVLAPEGLRKVDHTKESPQ